MGNRNSKIAALAGAFAAMLVVSSVGAFSYWCPPAGTNITYQMIKEIWLGQGERHEGPKLLSRAGFVSGWTDTRIPLDATVTIYDGFTNVVTVEDGGAWTSSVRHSIYTTTNISDDAIFLPFTHTVVNGTNITTTNYASITRQHIVAMTEYELEVELFDIGLAYVLTNHATSGNFDDWFAKSAGSTNPVMFPRAHRSAVFMTNAIGYVTNVVTDMFGHITNGLAVYTRQPEVTQNWTMADIRLKHQYDANGVRVNTNVLIDTRINIELDFQDPFGDEERGGYYIGTNTPALVFISSPWNTNSFTSIGIDLSGEIIFGFGTTSATETVTISSTNKTRLSKQWQKITSATVSSGDHTNYMDGTTFWIGYDQRMVFYGGRPYTIYAHDLCEWQRYLDQLRWTYDNANLWYATNAVSATYTALGQSTVSVAEAWANAIADMNSHTSIWSFPYTTTLAPYETFECSRYDYTNPVPSWRFDIEWNALITRGEAKHASWPGLATPAVTYMSTNLQKVVDIYAISEPLDGYESFLNSSILPSISSNVYKLAASSIDGGYYGRLYVGPDLTNETEVASPDARDWKGIGWWGDTNALPSEALSAWQPTTNGTIAGVRYKALYLIRWDASTNGFKYVR